MGTKHLLIQWEMKSPLVSVLYSRTTVYVVSFELHLVIPVCSNYCRMIFGYLEVLQFRKS